MNNNNEQHHTIHDNVLEKIRQNEVKMRPRLYFTLKFIALIVVALLISIVSVFIFSFMLFSIRATSEAMLLGFGSRGWYLFFLMFPWPLLFIDVVLIAVLEWLLRQFRFGYKKSVVYLLLGLIVAIVSLGYLLDRGAHLHEGLLDRADHHNLPFMEGMYEKVRRPLPHGSGVCRCVVISINGNTLAVVDDHPLGTTTIFKVILPTVHATTSLKIGDRIFVVGQVVNGELHAMGIKTPEFNR